ncbi:MAG: ABC transporter substrate-binding protein [Egibacteraceae bacterium]
MTVRPIKMWMVLLAVLALAAAACTGGGDDAAVAGGDTTPEADDGEPDVEAEEGELADGEADAELEGDPVTLGFVSVFSGRVAMLGATGFKGAQFAAEEINEAGGVLDGRPLQIAYKDTAADPEQAVRLAREFVLQDDVDFIIDGSSSNEAFAVSQASSDLDTIVLTTASEADSLTEPENFQELVFRIARNTQMDGIANAQYVSELGLQNWMAISPDYAYGRDCNARFFEALQELQTDVSVGTQLWPALFEPDYTPLIQQIVDSNPDAVYSCLWGGDLVAFMQQAAPFGLFDTVEFVTPNVADSLVLDTMGDALPEGIHTGSRFAVGSPPTEANEQFDAAYRERFGEGPTNWSIQAYVAVNMLADALEAVGSVDDTEALTAELENMELAGSPWGDVQVRGEDHTLYNYNVRWGTTDPSLDYPVDFTFEADWDQLLEMEGGPG